jgi:hypothetical protein
MMAIQKNDAYSYSLLYGEGTWALVVYGARLC